ncbi:transmembrane emp24 domain-containing protein p24delta9-like isoform X2 [Lycium barbarum]|uniref:transmembrane emp24 domain-containing protein p24delta9-like isoform X2 n=1 Tax=Lycium barbarum TaxID=112863 RepID=UPI00293EDFC9|nr:transmembrane emp24 domain-containing protein p24delta9-like isoform X2 [Lycium barbarum]
MVMILRNEMWRLIKILYLLICVIIVLLSSLVDAIRFDLISGTTKCITEEIMHDAMTVGKYSVVNPNEGYPLPDNHRITVRVTSPYGNNYHYMNHVESGTFAFTASEGGDYMTCLWAVDQRPPLNLSIDFEWKSGVAAKDWSNIAKRGQIHVQTLGSEIRQLRSSFSYFGLLLCSGASLWYNLLML